MFENQKKVKVEVFCGESSLRIHPKKKCVIDALSPAVEVGRCQYEQNKLLMDIDGIFIFCTWGKKKEKTSGG